MEQNDSPDSISIPSYFKERLSQLERIHESVGKNISEQKLEHINEYHRDAFRYLSGMTLGTPYTGGSKIITEAQEFFEKNLQDDGEIPPTKKIETFKHLFILSICSHNLAKRAMEAGLWEPEYEGQLSILEKTASRYRDAIPEAFEETETLAEQNPAEEPGGPDF